MQGNIISKVWMYKDRMNMVQGPFMSYDMDIWNGEENFFSDDMTIALGSGPFLPLQLYVDRDPIVVELVENFLLKSQQIVENMNQMKKKRGYNQNNKNQNQNQNSNHNQPNKTIEKELNKKYQENFPSLGTTTATKWETPANKTEAPLLDILRSGHGKPAKPAEDKLEKPVSIDGNNKQRADQISQPSSTVEIKLVKSSRKNSTVNSNNASKQNGKNFGKGRNEPKYSYPEDDEPIYIEKKVEPPIEGNAELTNNLKNLLGL